MSVQRIFLGWDEPCVALAARHFITHYRRDDLVDLSSVAVVLPSRRAARRLVEQLVLTAEGCDCGVIPPRLLTVGEIPEWIHRSPRMPIGDLEAIVAWMEALHTVDRAVLAPILAPAINLDAFLDRYRLARSFDSLYTELAASGLDFAAVAARAQGIASGSAEERWLALDALYRQYVTILQRGDRIDRHRLRIAELESANFKNSSELVLVACSDLNELVKSFIGKVTSTVRALIFAPEIHAKGFDRFGSLHTEYWIGQELQLLNDQINCLHRAPQQADAVLHFIGSLPPDTALEDVTVGVADQSLAELLEQRLSHSGIAVRNAVGLPIGVKGPPTFLAAAASFLRGNQFADFAALVRQIDVQRWISQQGASADAALTPTFLSALDRYQREHLPEQIAVENPGKSAESAPIDALYRAIADLLEPLRGSARPLAEWYEPVARCLTALYSARVGQEPSAADRELCEICVVIREMLDAFTPIIDRQSAVTADVALDVLVERLSAQRVAPEIESQAVELLGWLELQLDDAPYLVISGMAEGVVPESINNDPFLPNALRRELGLLDNDRRLARDLFAFASMLASRQRVAAVTALHNLHGEPNPPSRLLYRCPAEEAARRVLRFYGETKNVAGSTVSQHHVLLQVPPRPLPLSAPPRTVRATAFRDYLRCPYRFYLKHVLRLESESDSAAEMDGRVFGTLAHELFSTFALSDLRECRDAKRLADGLHEILDQLRQRQFGTKTLPAVKVQLEQLRMRLGAFAIWQAAWRSAGWAIQKVEHKFSSDDFVLRRSGGTIAVVGQIDRIDQHESSGEYFILDYKTADRVTKSRAAHYCAGSWRDLQLPIYYLYAQRHLAGGDAKAGYLHIPAAPDGVGNDEAAFSAPELLDAERVMCEVADGILQQRFWPPAKLPAAFDEYAALCGSGQFIADARSLGLSTVELAG